ncbi:hypothetical protein HaLaN_24360, partial [Haematococcus lacustris]
GQSCQELQRGRAGHSVSRRAVRSSLTWPGNALAGAPAAAENCPLPPPRLSSAAASPACRQMRSTDAATV